MNKENEQIIDNLKTSISAAEAILAILEAQQAEPEKPKLRHGDYGLDGGKRPYIIISGKSYWLRDAEENRESCCPIESFDGNLGNLADDLAARSEPLKEFEIDSNRIFLNTFGNIQIESNLIGGGYVTIDSIVFHEFNLKCRQVEAFLSQQAK